MHFTTPRSSYPPDPWCLGVPVWRWQLGMLSKAEELEKLNAEARRKELEDLKAAKIAAQEDEARKLKEQARRYDALLGLWAVWRLDAEQDSRPRSECGRVLTCVSLGWRCGDQAGLHGACPAPERARADRGVVQQAGATATQITLHPYHSISPPCHWVSSSAAACFGGSLMLRGPVLPGIDERGREGAPAAREGGGRGTQDRVQRRTRTSPLHSFPGTQTQTHSARGPGLGK